MSIEFKEVRYIKLGKGGFWNDVSLDNDEIHFGFGGVSHEIGLLKNFDRIKEVQLKLGKSAGPAANDAREVFDFYNLGRECLWITFARGHLYWTFSDPEVFWLGDDGLGCDNPDHGQRKRSCIGWSKFDGNGVPLRVDGLSTSLTKVASYRRTICRVTNSEDYLRRRINGLNDPLIQRASIANDSMLDVLDQAIAKLHQTDFETLADVIFARSGWHRTSALGGTLEFIDLAIEQPATGERGAVQVKSRADQAVLDDYIKRFDEAGTFERLFFVCHTASSVLTAPDRDDVHIWQGRKLSEQVFRLGLSDWVLQRLA